MPLTQSDIDSFHQFASQALPHCDSAQGLEELVGKWRQQREQEQSVASLRRGIEDADAGRFHDLSEIDDKIRESVGFPARRT